MSNELPVWTLADRLRKIRRDRHLTQEEMARLLGIKPVTWAAWEADRNRPEDVVRLANMIEQQFGVPAAWTLGVLHGRRVGDNSPLLRAVEDDRQWEWMNEPMPERISA